MVFEIIAKDKKSQARVGLLKTKSGKIGNSFFYACRDQDCGKACFCRRFIQYGGEGDNI